MDGYRCAAVVSLPVLMLRQWMCDGLELHLYLLRMRRVSDSYAGRTTAVQEGAAPDVQRYRGANAGGAVSLWTKAWDLILWVSMDERTAETNRERLTSHSDSKVALVCRVYQTNSRMQRAQGKQARRIFACTSGLEPRRATKANAQGVGDEAAELLQASTPRGRNGDGSSLAIQGLGAVAHAPRATSHQPSPSNLALTASSPPICVARKAL